MEDRLDRFPALGSVGWIDHLFTTRLCAGSRHADDAALIAALPIRGVHWRLAEQVHGAGAAVVDASSPRVTAGVDALCTNTPGVVLGISVADCCAVYVVDSARRAIGLAHSGRRGTELHVLGALVGTMAHAFGSAPPDLIVQMSPCIRPPHYEVDFAAQIRAQAEALGVGALHDCAVCTAARLDRYFSYRAEKGATGRMLAALGICRTFQSPAGC